MLVGIVNISGGFYRSFDKINQNYLTGIKITKLGREIIDISIISPVHTHKLLIPQGIYRNFDIFPQKVYIKANGYSNLGYHWCNFATIHQVYVFLSSSKYIIQRVYAILRVKIHIVQIHGVKRLTLKRFFNVKPILFLYFCQGIKIAAYHRPSTISHKKFKFQYFLQNTINTTAQSTDVFSTIAHLLSYNRCQFFLTFPHGDRAIHPIHSTVLSKQLV